MRNDVNWLTTGRGRTAVSRNGWFFPVWLLLSGLSAMFFLSGCRAVSFTMIPAFERPAEVAEFPTKFYLRDPNVQVSPEFEGYNPLYDPPKRFTSYWDRPILLANFEFLPEIQRIDQFAQNDFPALFTGVPAGALPVYSDIVLTKLVREMHDQKQSGQTFIADFCGRFYIETAENKKELLAEYRFSMEFIERQFFLFVFVPSEKSSRKVAKVVSGFDKPKPFYDAFFKQFVVDLAIRSINNNREKIVAVHKARAEIIQSEKADRQWALVVGVSKYRYPEEGLTPLAFADKDAESMYQVFIDNLNRSRGRTFFLINEYATKQKVMEELDKIASKMKENDLLTIYWSGHGYSRGDDIYLACHDTRISDAESGIRMAWLRDYLARKKVRRVLFISDTCHAGGIMTGFRGSRTDAVLEGSSAEQFGGWIFMLASEASRQAVEDKQWGHGAFTYCLLQGLKGAADGFEGAGNRDGVVTPAELRAYLTSRVPAETQSALGSAIHPLVSTDSANPKIWEVNINEE